MGVGKHNHTYISTHLAFVFFLQQEEKDKYPLFPHSPLQPPGGLGEGEDLGMIPCLKGKGGVKITHLRFTPFKSCTCSCKIKYSSIIAYSYWMENRFSNPFFFWHNIISVALSVHFFICMLFFFLFNQVKWSRIFHLEMPLDIIQSIWTHNHTGLLYYDYKKDQWAWKTSQVFLLGCIASSLIILLFCYHNVSCCHFRFTITGRFYSVVLSLKNLSVYCYLPSWKQKINF